MHPLLVKEIVKNVKARAKQGDCPTIAAYSVETLEDAIIELSKAEAKAEGDMVMVPKSALDWLYGEAPDADGKWFHDVYDEVKPIKAIGDKPAYWWRSHFSKLISAAQPVQREQQPADASDRSAAP